MADTWNKQADAATRARLLKLRLAMGLSQAELAAKVSPQWTELTVRAYENLVTGPVLRTYEELVLRALDLDHAVGKETARAVLYAAHELEAPKPQPDGDCELRTDLARVRARLGLSAEAFAGRIGLPAGLVKDMEREGSGAPLRAYCFAVAGALHTAGMDIKELMPPRAYCVAWGVPPGPQGAGPLTAPAVVEPTHSATGRSWCARLVTKGSLLWKRLVAWIGRRG